MYFLNVTDFDDRCEFIFKKILDNNHNRKIDYFGGVFK